MAYYGGYGSTQYAGYPTMQGYGGLASYGCNYRVNQPLYYAGPSYSTTSDNDFLVSMPAPSYGASGCATAPTGYAAPAYYNTGVYPPEYFQQQAAVTPTFQPQSKTFSQQQQQQPQQAATPQPQSTSASASGSGSQVQMQPVQDDLSQLAPQIDAAYQAATGQRRQPMVKRQIITLPGQPAKVQQVVRRLPTPTPDLIERVFVVKPARDIVNLVIERPATPPAQYKDKTVVGKPRRPLITPKIIRVPPKTQFHLMPPYQQGYMLPYAVPVTYQPQPQSFTQQYQPQMSQTELTQPTMSQIQPQASFVQQKPTRGYLVAPVQYCDEGYGYSAVTPTLSYAPVVGGAVTPMPMPTTGTLTGGSPPMTPYYNPAALTFGTGYSTRFTPTNYFASTAGYPSPYGATVY